MIKHPIYRIVGAGIAGQVLAKELLKKRLNIQLQDSQDFPRRKVCGGVLQRDTWQYLKSAFDFKTEEIWIEHATHYAGKKLMAEQQLNAPMVYIRRFEMDHSMMQSFDGKQIRGGEGHVVHINASGIQHDVNSEWLGFEASSDPVNGLEMRYGRHIYAGRCPDTDRQSHLALIVHRDAIKSKKIQDVLRNELGIHCTSRPKGTRSISYRYYDTGLAVGDAKMTSHPLFGFGMKHAVLSARLLAKCIEQNQIEQYPLRHRKMFSRIFWMNRMVDGGYRLFGGKMLALGLALPGVLNQLHRQVHSKKEERFIEAL